MRNIEKKSDYFIPSGQGFALNEKNYLNSINTNCIFINFYHQ